MALGILTAAEMRGLLGPADGADRFHGVVVGVVTNNQDPDGMHRVKVRFPWLSGEDESHWARVAAAMAGNDRGAYFLPEVDDEVLVAFEHGDLRLVLLALILLLVLVLALLILVLIFLVFRFFVLVLLLIFLVLILLFLFLLFLLF